MWRALLAGLAAHHIIPLRKNRQGGFCAGSGPVGPHHRVANHPERSYNLAIVLAHCMENAVAIFF